VGHEQWPQRADDLDEVRPGESQLKRSYRITERRQYELKADAPAEECGSALTFRLGKTPLKRELFGGVIAQHCDRCRASCVSRISDKASDILRRHCSRLEIHPLQDTAKPGVVANRVPDGIPGKLSPSCGPRIQARFEELESAFLVAHRHVQRGNHVGVRPLRLTAFELS
jgi:hypothetical protein